MTPENATPFAPIWARLLAQGFSTASAASFEADSAHAQHGLLLLHADPVKFPEVADQAVIVPEILKAFPAETFQVWVADLTESAALAKRFGVLKFPALVFLREGHYVGMINGLLDWQAYLTRCQDMLSAPVQRPPSIGIPVHTATTGGC